MLLNECKCPRADESPNERMYENCVCPGGEGIEAAIYNRVLYRHKGGRRKKGEELEMNKRACIGN